MAESSQRKAELVARIAASREGISESLAGLKEDLDFGKRFRDSFQEKKSLWLTGAAVGGWLIARLPGRRRKPAPALLPPPTHSHGLEKQAKGGVFLAIVSFALTLFKPAITRFATDYVSQWARESASLLQRPKR